MFVSWHRIFAVLANFRRLGASVSWQSGCDGVWAGLLFLMTTMTVDAALARSPALVKQRSEVQTQLQLASLKLEEFQDVLVGCHTRGARICRRLAAELTVRPCSQAGVVSPRGFWWLGDQQDEAAELVALLNEAAPKLALSGLHTPPRQRSHLPKARSFELLPDTIRHRLARAVPVPTGGLRHGAHCHEFFGCLLRLEGVAPVHCALSWPAVAT